MERDAAALGASARSSLPAASPDTTRPLPTIARSSHPGGGGHELPTSIRELLEARAGVDLSPVRVHSDAVGDRVATERDAEAVAFGNSIYFARDAYDPSTHSGRELLGHEAAHVVQQMGPSGVGPRIQRAPAPPDKAERRRLNRAKAAKGILIPWLNRIRRREEKEKLDTSKWEKLRARHAEQVLLLNRHGELGQKLSSDDELLLDKVAGKAAASPQAQQQPTPVTPPPAAQPPPAAANQPAMKTIFYATLAAENLGFEMSTDYTLGDPADTSLATHGAIRTNGETTWTKADLEAVKKAFDAVSSDVQTKVINGADVNKWNVWPDPYEHQAQVRPSGSSGRMAIEITDAFSGLGSAVQHEMLIHEFGHGVEFRFPDVYKAFKKHVKNNPPSQDDLKAVGGSAFAKYMIDQWSSSDPGEYFAHVYAAKVLRAGTLPASVKDWANNNLP